MNLATVIILVLCLSGAAVIASGAKIENVTTNGVDWTGATWGYSTPKLLYDGQRVYAVSLAGPYPDHTARLHWRDESGWHEGTGVSPVYQPATLLLDSTGHINLFATEHATKLRYWRSVRPNDVTEFVEQSFPSPETFAYGYLGAGTDGRTTALVGLDSSYSLWLTYRHGMGEWSKAVLLVPGVRDRNPNVTATYPMIVIQGNIIHVIYSNCPDGIVHNTYNRVEHIAFDTRTDRVAASDTVARGRGGEMTYGLDAVLAPDGTLYVIYAGCHVYGRVRPGIEERDGVFCAVLKPGQTWHHYRIADKWATGQLHLSSDGTLRAFMSSSSGTRCHASRDGGRSWSPKGGELAWEGDGFFLCINKSRSGSLCDNVLRGLQSRLPKQVDPAVPRVYVLDYVEKELGAKKRSTRKSAE